MLKSPYCAKKCERYNRRCSAWLYLPAYMQAKFSFALLHCQAQCTDACLCFQLLARSWLLQHHMLQVGLQLALGPSPAAAAASNDHQ